MINDFFGIHPDLRRIAEKTPRITYSKRNIWLFNLLMRLMPTPRLPDDIYIDNVVIPSQDERTKIRLRIYRPKSLAAPTPALLWLHGGGYVMGSPKQDDVRCAHYAQESGITVVSVDYRYAPKYPFPAGLEDCYTALKWVASKSQQIGVDKSHIAIGGASAGGGLAASLAQCAHDRREIKPVFQLLVYPMLDDRTALCAHIDDSTNVTWNHKSNRFGWESYLGQKCGAEAAPECSVPARRLDLSGLPPAWIGVGTTDMFHAEDLAYAQRLSECGVECEVYTVPGAFHGFDVFDHTLQIVQKFRESQVSALRKYLFS